MFRTWLSIKSIVKSGRTLVFLRGRNLLEPPEILFLEATVEFDPFPPRINHVCRFPVLEGGRWLPTAEKLAGAGTEYSQNTHVLWRAVYFHHFTRYSAS